MLNDKIIHYRLNRFVKDCRGLNNCRGRVKTISISQALKEGRTPCEICYRQQY